MKTVVLATLLLATSVAHADDDDRDPDTARTLSIAGSVAPAVLMGAGALMAAGSHGDAQNAAFGVVAVGAIAGLVTPALGELYGHQWFTGGMAMRTGGFITANIGFFLAYNTEIGQCTSSPCHLQGESLGFVLVGAGLYLGGIYFDVTGAPDSVREWNREHHTQVVPTALKTPSSTAPGVALALTF